MKVYIVMEGLSHSGESFYGVFSTLDKAIKRVEDGISRGHSRGWDYYNIIETELDKPGKSKEIDFREEVEMKCYGCGEHKLLLVGSEAHSDWIDLHREKLNHVGGIDCVGNTGRIELV